MYLKMIYVQVLRNIWYNSFSNRVPIHYIILTETEEGKVASTSSFGISQPSPILEHSITFFYSLQVIIQPCGIYELFKVFGAASFTVDLVFSSPKYCCCCYCYCCCYHHNLLNINRTLANLPCPFTYGIFFNPYHFPAR